MDLLLHHMPVIHFFFPVLQGIIRSDLVFFPHIGNPCFPVLFDLFCLSLQSEAFFVQKTDLARQLITLFKKLLMAFCALFLFLLPFFQLFCSHLFFCGKAFDLLTDLVDRLSLFCSFLAAFFQRIQNFFPLFRKNFDLLFQAPQIFLYEAFLLLGCRCVKTDPFQLL